MAGSSCAEKVGEVSINRITCQLSLVVIGRGLAYWGVEE